MNLRTVKSILTIVVVVSGMLAAAGWTLASWSDSVTSSGNTFTTGNLDLKARPMGSPTWVDGPVVGVWHAEDMYPGQEFDASYIEFRNMGSVKGRTFDIAVTNVVTQPEMDKYIQITLADYENDSSHDLISQSDPIHIPDGGKGYVTLYDLEHNPVTGLPAPDTSGSLTMKFKFRPEAGNEFQNKSVTANFAFTLQQ
jgi:predicted ribosomally synthesized peptide with SipW-like signal peptide